MKIIAIDPSINNTGYAVFNDKKLILSGRFKPIKGSTIEKIDWLQNQLYDLKDEVLKNKHSFNVDGDLTVVIEFPPSFSYARSTKGGRGMNHAAMQKLNISIGIISGFFMMYFSRIVFVPVKDWKGNRPKSEFEPLAYALAGNKEMSSDEVDAICLGGWYIKGGYKC